MYDIIDFYTDKDIDMLVLVNPDNPSGNYIEKGNFLKLCQWSDGKGIKLVVDESFVDFAEGEDNTLINNSILEEHQNLIVVKSISKSYGVFGLRRGILVFAQKDLKDSNL